MSGYRSFSAIQLFGLFISLLLAVSACSIFGVEGSQITPTPAPTSSVPGLQVIPPQACLISEHGMIRLEQPQGDLIAWSPITDTVAYVASTTGSTWNVGELNILSAPSFADPVRLAAQVSGELTWSPEGISIAYLSLRRSDNLYTIGLVNPDGGSPMDFFPDEAARTDGFSSQKAILEWLGEGRLRLMTSCGMDCMQRLDFRILSGFTTTVGAPVQRTWDQWSVQTHHPTTIPPAYADLKGQLNWSPDESQIAYIDEEDSVWVVNVETGSLYPLDIGGYGTATETDWSYDNQYLAVHVDQYLKIFSFECP